MARLGGVDRHGAGHRPDRLLEPEEISALGAAMVERGDEDGGADRRVSGKGHLEPGREDAQAGPMLGVLRGQDEHRLREVELARDLLHRGRVEAVCVQHHGERIAGEAGVGEDVERMIATRHDQTFSTGKRRLGATNSSCASTVRISFEPASAVRRRRP